MCTCLLYVGNNDVTVGKFYATFLIQEWFRRWKQKKAEEQKALLHGQSKRHSIMPFKNFAKPATSLLETQTTAMNSLLPPSEETSKRGSSGSLGDGDTTVNMENFDHFTGNNQFIGASKRIENGYPIDDVRQKHYSMKKSDWNIGTSISGINVNNRLLSTCTQESNAGSLGSINYLTDPHTQDSGHTILFPPKPIKYSTSKSINFSDKLQNLGKIDDLSNFVAVCDNMDEDEYSSEELCLLTRSETPSPAPSIAAAILRPNYYPLLEENKPIERRKTINPSDFTVYTSIPRDLIMNKLMGKSGSTSGYSNGTVNKDLDELLDLPKMDSGISHNMSTPQRNEHNRINEDISFVLYQPPSVDPHGPAPNPPVYCSSYTEPIIFSPKHDIETTINNKELSQMHLKLPTTPRQNWLNQLVVNDMNGSDLITDHKSIKENWTYLEKCDHLPLRHLSSPSPPPPPAPKPIVLNLVEHLSKLNY
ncbi:Voltage-dependent calcium channel type D subunit alpha-1 [Schistosoma japonicum]|nr:Voltage-dependent calcium channel type D subunit alpha-1 [Schistosoma japonicum]